MTPDAKPRPPLTTTTSILPAMIVLGVAVATLVVFMAINLVADRGVTTTTTIPVVVGGLGLDRSSTVLSDCVTPGSPPADVVTAIVVPVNTHPRGPFKLPNSGAGDFDCYRPLVTSTNAPSLLAFYKTQLEARGWTLFSSGASNGAPQYLFQKAGSDTFYWVVGITVNPSVSTANVTAWTYRIYQNSTAI